ncbi:MAG: hydrogenase maturation protease [Coriobacteriaceae bacterium]|nr:hydrogenase maturation protease [Coriobacteriaceae bacterium]
MDIAVICVGNEYRRDDGFGSAVARHLAGHYVLPGNVRVLDRAVMGYAVVPDLMSVKAAVVVDALDGTGEAPGTVLAFDPDDMAGSGEMMSLHEVRFADVLAAARFMGARCAVGRCFGAQIADAGAGALERGLTPAVAAAVKPCAEAVVAYLERSMNCAIERKTGDELEG